MQPHLIGSCRGKDSPPGRAHRAGSPLLAGGAPALVTAEPDSPTLYCESVSYQVRTTRAATAPLLQVGASPCTPARHPRVSFPLPPLLQHGAYSVQGRLRSAAPAELVYQVLTDYHALASVFHNVDDCHVTQTEEGERLLVQTVNWHFLIFRGSFVTELLVDEGPDLQLSFSLLRSAFMRQFIGSWEVTAAEGGGSDIRHSLSIVPTLSPPQKIGDLTKSIFVSQVEGILGDLAAELDTRAAQQAQQQQEAGARETERASPRER